MAAYTEALKESTRERVPLGWAMTQNNLGNALVTLGKRESGAERLEQAVTTYTEALKEHTRERVPLDWAMTQNNLGAALTTLGKRESGTEQPAQGALSCSPARPGSQGRCRDCSASWPSRGAPARGCTP